MLKTKATIKEIAKEIADFLSKYINLNYRDKKGNPNPVKFVSYIWKRIDGFIHSRLQNRILQGTYGQWPLSIPPKKPRASTRVGSIIDYLKKEINEPKRIRNQLLQEIGI